MEKYQDLKKELFDFIQKDVQIFDFIFSAVLDGIWYLDVEEPERKWLSPNFLQTLGYPKDDAFSISLSWVELLYEEDLEAIVVHLKKHLEDPHKPYDQVVRYRHKEGHTVYLRSRGMALRTEEGKPYRMLGTHTDITHLKATEKELLSLSSEYETVFHGTKDAMFLMAVSTDGTIRYLRNNLAHQEKTGISLEMLRNKTPEELLGQETAAKVLTKYRSCLQRKTRITYEETLTLPQGERIWSTTLSPIFTEGIITHLVGSATDITAQRKLEEELVYYANYDKLTNLPNRRLFFDRLESLIFYSAREKESFALLFIDLDGFKGINDTHGHEVGDEVLKKTAQRISSTIRKSDTAARMGGDEFTVLLRDVKSKDSLAPFLQKLLTLLQEDMVFSDVQCSVGASIGVALYPQDGKDGETLLRNADATMYRVKKKGKGQVAFA